MARVPEIIRRNPLSQVAPTPAPSGQGFAALADIMGAAADFIKPAVEQQVKIEGQNAVYRDTDGQLKVDEKSIFSGEMGAIHNAAAFSKYLAQKGIDIDQTMNELAVQYEFDPDGFKQAADGYIGILREDENVPAVLKDDLIGQVEKSAARSFNGLFRNQVRREQSESERATATRRDMLADDYTSLIVAGDTEGAAEVWKQIEEISRFRANAPYMAETDVEREAYLRGVQGTATYATVLRKLDDLEGADEISDELRAEIVGLSENANLNSKQRDALYKATQGRLKAIDARALVKELTDTSFNSQVMRVLEGAAVGGAAARGDSFTNLDPDFARNVSQMVQDAKAAGIDLQITSAYRSPETQARIVADNMGKYGLGDQKAAWEADVASMGPEAAGQKWRETMRGAGLTKFVAMPGTSQHQQGRAVDFAVGGRLIRDPNSKAAKWIKANAGNYGLDVPMSWEPWEVRPGGIAPPSETDRLRNQAALTDAGVSITPGNEFLATMMGAAKAAEMLSADPTADAADFLPDSVVEQFPVLGSMTVRDAQNWAARKMHMSSQDLANQQVQVNQIEDAEVRALASRALADRVREQQAIETATATEYEERLVQGDPTLTEQEVLEELNLSLGDQQSLVRGLQAARKKQEDLLDFGARLAQGGQFNPMDTGDKNSLNDYQKAVLGDASPLSTPEATQTAYAIAKQAGGTMARDTFTAFRTQLQSSDPEALGATLETLAQFAKLGDSPFANYDGRKAVEDMLADFEFYGEFGSAQEAAAQIIKNREEKPKNLTTQAKEVVKGLEISEVKDHFGKWIFSNPEIGVEEAGEITQLSTAMQENEMMGTYSRLVNDAFLDTGDAELAKNRALKQMDRIYGVNMVSGRKRLMKYPPNGMYPAINGGHDWMTDELEREVSAFVYGEEVAQELGGLINMGNPSEKWIDANRIKLVSDGTTAAEVRAGVPPSYVVYYRTDEGLLEQLPQRFDFNVQAARETARGEFDAARTRVIEQQAVDQERVDTQQELTQGILDRFDQPLRARGFSPEDVVNVPSPVELESGIQSGTIDPTKPVLIDGMIYYPEFVPDGSRPK